MRDMERPDMQLHDVFGVQIIAQLSAPKGLSNVSRLLWGLPAFSQGQFDTYDDLTDRARLPLVVGAHFTPKVEPLKFSKTGGELLPKQHRLLTQDRP
ncbi:MAG: hypothetical protein Q7T10_19040 [Rhodoferax sp.]|uniref:hypothetical protein n=1 Tax=Rhodoferax sp. TaxID=50421 RepID=UPI002725FC45|nr:hypothetical protein [Rhodoferax sp.]MDO8450894.1 hypothetical protein [Rhodoferax sp.]